MRKSIETVVCMVVVLMFPALAMAADEVPVPELIQNAAEHAGEVLVVEGELVGDYGFRGDGWMWTQINGDPYAILPVPEGGSPSGGNAGIGVRIPAEMASNLDPPGGYRHRGPVVRIEGTWKYNDPERLGETYLEARSVVVVDPGRLLEQPISWPAVVAGLVLIGAAAVVRGTRPSE